MKLYELEKPMVTKVTLGLLTLMEAKFNSELQKLKSTIADVLLSYKTTAPGNPRIPLDKFLDSLSVSYTNVQSDKSLIIEILEELTDIVKEVDVANNQIVLKSALTLRNKTSEPEKNKQKVSQMAIRAIKTRTK